MTGDSGTIPDAGRSRPGLTRVHDRERPIVVVGAHSQSLFMHVDAIPAEGETVTAFGYEETADGGKATNQAVAAARLGAPVRFVSLVGNDERGRRILDYLDGLRIDRRWVHLAEGPTDVGFVMLSPHGIPAIATCQDLSRHLDRQFVEQAAPALAGASIVVCQLEAPPECAQAAFEIARANGAMTILNPAPMVPLPRGLLELVDVLVPNEHEAADIVGRDGPVAQLADRLAGMVPRAHVIVTAGGDGAFLASVGTPSEHILVPKVRAVDTTGAGDAFVGALAVGLRDGQPVSEAATFAVRSAAVSVTRPGTLDAYATRDAMGGAVAIPATRQQHGG
jgi:ribokinase